LGLTGSATKDVRFGDSAAADFFGSEAAGFFFAADAEAVGFFFSSGFAFSAAFFGAFSWDSARADSVGAESSQKNRLLKLPSVGRLLEGVLCVELFEACFESLSSP